MKKLYQMISLVQNLPILTGHSWRLLIADRMPYIIEMNINLKVRYEIL
jgi:hypothetical protein